MAVSKYRRFGLRADKNLSDLLDPDRALTHVLDDLVTGTPFTGFDLKVINGLRNTNVNADDLSELKGQVKTYSPILIAGDGFVSVLEPEPVTPVPSIQSIITDRKTIFGDPSMFKGGSGPYSTVFSGAAVNVNTGLNGISPFDRTHETVIDDEDYWIEGYFGFSGSIHPSYTDNFGGIEWEGYLAVPADQQFTLRTNGYFLIEKEYPSQEFKNNLVANGATWRSLDDDYIPILRNDVQIRNFQLTQAATNTLELTGRTVDTNSVLDLDLTFTNLWDQVMVFVGDTITIGSTIYEVTNVVLNNLDNAIIQKNNSLLTCTITVSPILGTDTSVTQINGSSFSIAPQRLGIDVRETNIPLDINWSDGKTKYRVTVWWPNPQDLDPEDERENYPSKYATFDFGDTTGPIPAPYNYWYKELPDYQGKFYSYQYFLNNRLSGRRKRTDTFLQSTKQIFSRYTPTVNIADKLGETSLVWNGKNKFTLYGGPGVFTGRGTLEPGDILLFDLGTIFNPAGQNVSDLIGSYPFAYGRVYEYDAVTGTVWTDPLLDYSDPNKAPGWTDVIRLGYRINQVFTIASSGLVGIFVRGTQPPVNASSYNSSTGLTTGTLLPINAESDSDIAYFPEELTRPFEIKKQNVLSGVSSFFSRTKFQRILTSKPLIESVNGANTNICEISSNRIGTNEASYDYINDFIPVYNHRGLVDASIDHQCNGVYGKEVKSFPEAAAGQQLIAVDSIDNIQVGDVVQYSPNIPQASLIVANTAGGVQHGTYSDPQGKIWPLIKIDKNIALALPTSYTIILIDKDYRTDYTIDGGLSYLDRGFCVLPFNTAPPFLGTSFGLSTSPSYPHLNVKGKFSFTELNVEQANTSVILNATSEIVVRGLEILTEDEGNTKYYMLSK